MRRRTLHLSKETLHRLGDHDLREVHGAAPAKTWQTCQYTCGPCPPPDTEGCSSPCSLVLNICL